MCERLHRRSHLMFFILFKKIFWILNRKHIRYSLNENKKEIKWITKFSCIMVPWPKIKHHTCEIPGTDCVSMLYWSPALSKPAFIMPFTGVSQQIEKAVYISCKPYPMVYRWQCSKSLPDKSYKNKFSRHLRCPTSFFHHALPGDALFYEGLQLFSFYLS